MKYGKIIKGIFIDRPNRFVSHVSIDGEIHTVHVKNTGRCKELLVPGVAVYLTECDNSERKTKFDLVAVDKENVGIVNIDSQLPNLAVYEWLPRSGLFSEKSVIKREYKYGNSRFDLYVTDGNRKCLIEVKGVTLERNAVALFPDAPTVRGSKHLKELTRSLEDGYEAYVIFVIQMRGVTAFTCNDITDPVFAINLQNAQKNGVKILAYDCIVTHDSLAIDREIPVIIRRPASF